MQHLTYDELEWYLVTSNDLEIDMGWLEDAMEHMITCDYCQQRLQRLLLISSVYDSENRGEAFSVLAHEEEIRREILALRLEISARDQRMQQLAMRLRAGLLRQRMVSGEDLLPKTVVMRGEEDALQVSNEGIIVTREVGIIKVTVACEEEKRVAVILAGQDDSQSVPMVAEAKWLREESIAVAEFEIGEVQESYGVYVDIF